MVNTWGIKCILLYDKWKDKCETLEKKYFTGWKWGKAWTNEE